MAMKHLFFLVAIVISLPSFAQTTLYQSFEVDSAAEVRGGITFFYTFVQANLRKPIRAEAQGVGGRVILEGVVNSDGRIAEAKVLQHLRPDCDQEALRVFKLFNAWKPAQKNGQPVSQKVTMPIMFAKSTPFTYENESKIDYFGSDNKLVTDSSQAQYKQISPMDTTGLPVGDIIVYKRKGTSWKEDFRLPLVRKLNPPQSPTGETIQLIGYQNSDRLWERDLFHLDINGARVRQEYYENGKKVGLEMTYHKNGSVADKTDDFTDKQAITSWYPTGQISQIRTALKFKALTPNQPDQVTGVWDSAGNQLVKDGQGQAVYQTKTTSRSDTTKETQFVEQGLYKSGFKQGIWTGRYADESYAYQETYDKGVCQSGKAWSGGADTTQYTVVMQQPEFPGGLQGLGQFLSQNLSYPASAQKAGVQGKVFISFVVCTDGTLCDYDVFKGVRPDIDQEAVRVVKKMSGKWKPGSYRGQRVRVKYNLPINFNLY